MSHVEHSASSAVKVPDGVTVTPARGRISTDGRADLNIHMQIDRAVRAASSI